MRKLLVRNTIPMPKGQEPLYWHHAIDTDASDQEARDKVAGGYPEPDRWSVVCELPLESISPGDPEFL